VNETILRLDSVRKAFGRVQAVDDVSLQLQRGEILTLLGPSGCGKTTTLRMVIGLERCSEGEITYKDRVVDSRRRRVFVPTHQRHMGMVFQSYAIWPHMTVYENVAYPLRVRRVPRGETQARVGRILDVVGLQGLERRPATQLSGGQQQRVALARSLVFEPDILLLDEPFSNLDAQLRAQMRAEVKALQRRLGVTVLFVTHDQDEALSLSDRIAVMQQGRVEQVGAPEELYCDPQTPAVRDFLGNTTLLRCRVGQPSANGRVLVHLDGQADTPLWCRNGNDRGLDVGQSCYLAIRPEGIVVQDGSAARSDQENCTAGLIETLLFHGDRYEARIRLACGQSLLGYVPRMASWREAQPVCITFPPDELRLWPA